MKPLSLRAGLGSLIVTAALVGCGASTGSSAGPAVVHPGAPGEPSRPVAAGAEAQTPRHTAADVRFMQDMIHHHAQALDMTALVEARTTREDIRQLARRIEASQADEIEMMRRWLTERGETAPSLEDHAAQHGAHAHHGHGGHHGHHGHGAHGGQAGAGAGHLMPGMLSREEMARLAAARGAEFERRFLEAMIYHHEGALTMVAELFGSPGGGQEAEIFQFASHVDSDQRIEIARMSRMLTGTR
jgi:uncharacterized protein (DUF305 family)